MNLDPNAKYQESHEWARPENDVYAAGITDFAQNSLSDVVYIELPSVGDSFAKGDIFGAVESVKSANDLYMPMGGEIVEVNEDLEDAPELVNDEPYGKGWMIKFKASSADEFDALLDGEAYTAVAEA